MTLKLFAKAKQESIYDNAQTNYNLGCKLLNSDHFGRGTREWMRDNVRNMTYEEKAKRQFPHLMTLDNAKYLTNDILDLYFDAPANYSWKLRFDKQQKQWQIVQLYKNSGKPAKLPIQDIVNNTCSLKSNL